MRRINPPYNGKRYILNRNTHEVHDLDRETINCRIDIIKAAHIYSCDSYEQALLASTMLDGYNCNGCVYCIPEKHTD